MADPNGTLSRVEGACQVLTPSSHQDPPLAIHRCGCWLHRMIAMSHDSMCHTNGFLYWTYIITLLLYYLLYIPQPSNWDKNVRIDRSSRFIIILLLLLLLLPRCTVIYNVTWRRDVEDVTVASVDAHTFWISRFAFDARSFAHTLDILHELRYLYHGCLRKSWP